MSRWPCYVLCAFAIVALTSVSLPRDRLAATQLRESQGPQHATLRFLGTSSCSARACHGGLEPAGKPETMAILRDEYPKWLLRDKHAHAYQALLEEPSLRIARNLAGEGVVLPPHKDVRCLACHALPQLRENVSELHLGVSCETCHGAARDWLVDHTGEGWRSLSSSVKKKKGMISVSDVNARAQACAACHVGSPAESDSPARDVNHDLIAAGHPRLNFEFSSFMANLPPHWNTGDAKRQAADGVGVWAVGQVESARAALRLLEFRADAKQNRPWPEFAEYDCFACHHDLEAASWRQKGGAAQRRPGTVPWGTWYFSMPSLLAEPELRTRLADLTRELEKPLPRRSLPIQPLSTELQALAGRLSRFDSKELTKILAAPVGDQGWDVAEQMFLAACAASEAQRRPEMRKALGELSRFRALPPEWGSPKNFSPRFFEDFRKALHEQR